MKMIGKAVELAKDLFVTAVEKVGTVEVEKRDGVFIARYLDPLNAKKWHDWAVKHGIPNPVPPEEMHVTVMYSLTDVKMARLELPIIINSAAEFGYQAGAFYLFGPKNDSLVYAFRCWELQDRHYAMLEHGAQPTWPTYRPHLTLSNNAAGFEISDDALADVPRYIVLGPEVNADLRQPDSSDTDQDGPEEAEDGDADLIIVIDIARAAAQKIVDAEKAEPKLTPIDAYAIADVARGRVTKGVAKRLAATDWAPQEIKDLAKAEAQPATPRMVEKDVVMTIGPLPADVAKKLKVLDKFKFQDEKRKAIGWASVSTIGGVYVEDLQGDTITTEAQHQFIESLFKGTRAAKLEHEGDDIGEVVQGLVFDEDLQKALGIDLGMEGLLTVTHYTCEKTWEKVKTGNWMHSIAGTMLVEE